MYILTSKYFPTDYWPDLYFPVLPEGADIQYKEVVEFTLAAILSADFEVVLPNDASVDVTGTDMVVSGAGTSAVNGTYVYDSIVNGKPKYVKSGTQFTIFWYSFLAFKYWQTVADSNKYYRSYDDVATPDLVTTWSVYTDGIAPIPTVTVSTSTALTEVAAFTLEMPMVITMEVYEELSL